MYGIYRGGTRRSSHSECSTLYQESTSSSIILQTPRRMEFSFSLLPHVESTDLVCVRVCVCVCYKSVAALVLGRFNRNMLKGIGHT